MLRFGIVLAVVVALTDCATIKDKQGLIERLKRSPDDCGPAHPPPPQFGPPPPPKPHPPPPPPPPRFNGGPHGRALHSSAYSEANAQIQSGFQSGANSQSLAGVQSSQSIPYSSGQGGQLGGYQNGGCDTCSGKSSAISNAQSNSGTAVAVAVAKGK